MKLNLKLSFYEGKQKTFSKLCTKESTIRITVSRGIHRCRKLLAKRGKETSSFDFSSRLFSEEKIADVISKKYVD